VAQAAAHVEKRSGGAQAKARNYQVEEVTIPPIVTLLAEKGRGMTDSVIAGYEPLLAAACIVN